MPTEATLQTVSMVSRRRSRTALAWLAFAVLLILTLWGSVARTQHVANGTDIPGWTQDFEVVVNGETWSLTEGLKSVIGWSVAALVIGAALWLALALLPVTLGLIALLVLLPVGLMLTLVALPVLLVLGLLLSPLLLLGGLAWLILA
jgi:hypothetical protein